MGTPQYEKSSYSQEGFGTSKRVQRASGGRLPPVQSLLNTAGQQVGVNVPVRTTRCSLEFLLLISEQYQVELRRKEHVSHLIHLFSAGLGGELAPPAVDFDEPLLLCQT